ncbi:MAG: TPM domain-containing protein [Stellaceae bacterium]
MAALTDQDRARVEAAVAAAERRTSAEFAVAVAHASDDYALYPLVGAAMIALIVGDIVALAVPRLTTFWLVVLQAALFVVADLVLHWSPVRHRLVPARVKKSHAGRLAKAQFAALVRNRTPDAVGVLLFVSVAEHHVEILVDRGIAARIDQAVWEKVIADFVAAVRAGHVAAALIGAIDAGTAILEKHFPPSPGAPNTIPDQVTEL